MKRQKVLVKAAPLADPALKGKARVPKEGTVNRWITELEPVEVELTPYYVRRLRTGDLVQVQPAAPATSTRNRKE